MNRLLVTASMALALTLVAAAPSAAQEQRPERDRGAEKRGAREGGERPMGQRMMRQGMPMRALFRGIELSEEQRTQLAALRGRYQPRMQELREAARAQSATVREARERGDTAAVRAAMAQHREARRALMEEQHREIRALLTEEQQVVFDRNVTEMRSRAEARAERARERRGQSGRRTPGGN